MILSNEVNGPVFWYLFISVERKAKEPILDPQVFTNRTFLTAAIAAFLSFFGMIGIMNYFPLFLQGAQGASAKISGAVLTPFSMLLPFMGVPAGLLIARTNRYNLMSKSALEELEKACKRIEEKKPDAFFDQTVEAIHDALQSGLKVLFLIGAIASLIGLMFILTIPEVSLDIEVQDKNPG